MSKIKIQRHIYGWKKALLLMFIASLMANIVTEGYLNITQYLSPSSSYYIYEEGNELTMSKDIYDLGENPRIRSNVQYFKPIQMTWYDTLYCDDVKYPTQEWRDFMHPKDIQQKNYWEYSKYKIKSEQNLCKICSHTVGTTSKGYEKVSNFCSPNFSFK